MSSKIVHIELRRRPMLHTAARLTTWKPPWNFLQQHSCQLWTLVTEETPEDGAAQLSGLFLVHTFSIVLTITQRSQRSTKNTKTFMNFWTLHSKMCHFLSFRLFSPIRQNKSKDRYISINQCFGDTRQSTRPTDNAMDHLLYLVGHIVELHAHMCICIFVCLFIIIQMWYSVLTCKVWTDLLDLHNTRGEEGKEGVQSLSMILWHQEWDGT